MKTAQLKKYAKLIAKMGLNVKKGQSVFIQAGLDQPEFVAMVVEECYKAGAKASMSIGVISPSASSMPFTEVWKPFPSFRPGKSEVGV